MKRTILFLALILSLACTGALSATAANRFYAKPMDIKPGETRTVEFVLDNEQQYFGFQADISLPHGLEVLMDGNRPDMELSQRAGQSFTVVGNTLADGTVRVGTFSTSHVAFSGDGGVLARMKVRASADFQGGRLSLGNVLFISADDRDVALPDCSSAVGEYRVDFAHVPDFSIAVGQTVTVALFLDNDTEFTAFQADLCLPEGLTANGGSFRMTGRASGDHVLSVEDIGGGCIRVACRSTSNSPFAGGGGQLVEFDVTASEGVAENCIMELKNQMCSTVDGKEYYLPNSATNVTTGLARVSEITLDYGAIDLFAGGTLALHPTIVPSYAYMQDLEWGSNAPEVATVSPAGVITAVAPGEAIITASATDGSGVSAACRVIVNPVLVESMALSQENWDCKVGESLTLSTTIFPDNATNKTIEWTTSDAAVATVDGNGNVSTHAVGEAIITATATDGSGVSATCHVTVNPVLVESMTLSQEIWDCKVGESLTLSATVLPDNATDKSVIWTSNNEDIATVDDNGNVSTHAVGEATITATATDGSGVSAICHVTVSPVLIESLTLSPDNWSGTEGETFQITAAVMPDNATNKTIEWTTSDAAVATVDSAGVVSVLKAGSCVITASTVDGSNLTAECIITGASGIDSMFADGVKVDVYNANGVLLKRGCGNTELKSLAPGVYIVRDKNKAKTIMVY